MTPKQTPQMTLALRDTLYGDLPIERWTADGAAEGAMPWSAFAVARERLAAGDSGAASAAWREIAAQPDLESRHYLQAWHFLRQHGQQPAAGVAKHVLGVVIEVAMAEGLDLLAAYADHRARYYNYSGAGVVWERPDASLDGHIDALLAASSSVVARIGPWDGPRPDPPPVNQVRLSFLTPSGLHFGQAGIETMTRDPLGGQVFHLATVLMQALTSLPR